MANQHNCLEVEICEPFWPFLRNPETSYCDPEQSLDQLTGSLDEFASGSLRHDDPIAESRQGDLAILSSRLAASRYG